MSRLIYENVAIGMILQRLAECRLINLTHDLRVLLTQQTRTLEDKYRDMAVAVGDKIAIIEFKAPDISGKNLRYEFPDKQIDKLKQLSRELDKNVFVGFIHAGLLPEVKRGNIGPTGTYKMHAVPSTTVFIPAVEIIHTNFISGSLILEGIYPGLEEYLKDSIFPECIYRTYLPKHPTCLTCGGIECSPLILYNYLVDLLLNRIIDFRFGKKNFSCSFLSLAQLLALMQSCVVGYKIENMKIFNDIVETIVDSPELAYTVILAHSPDRGITPILLSTTELTRPS
jgi:hypothetical protein